MSFELAREVLGYAKAELEKALRTGDTFLYRNAADKAFLALVVAVNACVRAIGGAEPASHSGRRLLGKMGREDLRALYSDLMRTLHEEAFYEGVYQPEEAECAFEKVEGCVEELERGAKRKLG
jgi:HEPN domain-containing protein